jgi:hypothetical protein
MTSTIKVNNIQNQCGANIINENSNTITIGASGDTVALASGANQSGFGRSGSVNWQTGSLKTTTFTAVSGEGYFINQSSAITVNLPAGVAGAIVAFSDYARNFGTYNFTVSPNGSEKIGGFADDAKLNVDGQAATFVYVDSTKGWINVQNAEDTEVAATFITATGGTETNSPCGDFKVHTFTGPGTFCVSAVGTPGGSTTVDWLVVGGGGGGGIGRANTYAAGGGGAGGMRFNFPNPVNAGTPVAVQGYPITVGAGGAKGPGDDTAGNNGSDSVAGLACGPYVSAGGGKGASGPGNASAGSGGSGGGAGYSGQSGAAGNTPPVTPPQGNDGGNAPGIPGPANPGINAGGGGGGHAGVGANSTGPQCGGGGGVGTPLTIADSPALPGGRVYAGGGSGAQAPTPASTGAPGGGGVGRGTTEKNGTANTGGGGGSGYPTGGGDGGSGVVIIRYKFQ